MAEKTSHVSKPVIQRLPRYYRFLDDLKAKGIERISSDELARKMRLTASQIRQDLNYFGGFGHQGYGYNVSALQEEIAGILGIDQGRKCILIGVGKLGNALASHLDFKKLGLPLCGLFDINPELIGQKIHGLTIQSSDAILDFCKKESPAVAVLCIPKETAEKLVPDLISVGIKGFWNFSHYDLLLHFDGIAVENVHLSDSLMALCFEVNKLMDE